MIADDCRWLPKTFEEDPKTFRSYTYEFKYNLRDNLDVSEIIDIFTSEDTENTPPEFRVWIRMNFTSGVFSSKTLVSIKYNAVIPSQNRIYFTIIHAPKIKIL